MVIVCHSSSETQLTDINDMVYIYEIKTTNRQTL